MTGIKSFLRIFLSVVRFIFILVFRRNHITSEALKRKNRTSYVDSFLAYFHKRYWIYKFLRFIISVLSKFFTIPLSESLILEVHGFRIYTPFQVGNLLMYDESYESHVVPLFRTLVGKGSTVIDAGASVGYYTLLAAKLVGKDGRVIALEPDKTRAHYLTKAIKLNGFTNVEVYKAFASDSEGVGTVTLDSLSENADLIKIDVEGMECKVLQGMKHLLSMGTHIILELHPQSIEQREIKKIEHLIEKNSYDVSLITSNGLVKVSSFLREKRQHYLLKKHVLN